jgi:hypothetical protein
VQIRANVSIKLFTALPDVQLIIVFDVFLLAALTFVMHAAVEKYIYIWKLSYQVNLSEMGF